MGRSSRKDGVVRHELAGRVLAPNLQPPGETEGVDHDLHQIAVTKPADRPSRERFRSDVADAGTGRDTGEARVGDERELEPPR